MNKSSMLLATSLLACNVASAADYYAGLNLGVNSVQIDKALTYPLGGATLTTSNFDPSYNGFHGQLFVGAGMGLANNFGVAIQGDADLFTSSANQTINNWFLTTPASVKDKLQYGFGLFLLPEYQFTDHFKIFAGPGVVWSKFKTSSGFTGGNIGVTGSFDEWLTGWAVKVGTSNRVTNNLDFLMTYQYDEFGKSTQANIEPLSGNALQGTYKPRANIFSVGVRYVFGEVAAQHYEK